jgi:iron complex transport system substrate-binding protein
MADDSSGHEAPTRREYVKYGGAVVGGGLLAGCAGTDSASTPTGTESGAAQDTDTPTDEEEQTSYEACIEPNGCYTFEEVPESIVTYEQTVTDMLIALDRTENLLATAIPDRYPAEYLEQLPGVSFDSRSVENSVGAEGKEPFYEWDADIHILDHRNAKNRFSLEDSDIGELEENLGPFYGSYLRRPDYEGGVYYDLFEGFQKVAQAFQDQPNAEALSEFHAELVDGIRSELPPVSERPSVAYMNTNFWEDGQTVFVWELGLPGAQYGPFRDLEIEKHSAFSGYHEGKEGINFQADFELLLDVDPEVIVYHGGLGNLRDPDRDYELMVGSLQDDPVASRVTAVEEDQIYPIHGGVQGPIGRLFQTELFAKVLYPDRFGEHPYAEPPYDRLTEPLPEEHRLFDRQELADIINGDIQQ